LKKLSKILIIVCLIVVNPVIVNSAEILQIKSSNTILVGDQNRNLTIGLFCVDVNENNLLIKGDGQAEDGGVGINKEAIQF